MFSQTALYFPEVWRFYEKAKQNSEFEGYEVGTFKIYYLEKIGYKAWGMIPFSLEYFTLKW